MILFVLILKIISISEQQVNEYLGYIVLNSNHAKESVQDKSSEILGHAYVEHLS